MKSWTVWLAVCLGILLGATACSGTEFGDDSPRNGPDLAGQTRLAAGATDGDADLYWLDNGSAFWYVSTNNINELAHDSVPATTWSAIGQTAQPDSGEYGVPVILVTYVTPSVVGEWKEQPGGAKLFATLQRPGGETVEVWAGPAAQKYSRSVLLDEIEQEISTVPKERS